MGCLWFWSCIWIFRLLEHFIRIPMVCRHNQDAIDLINRIHDAFQLKINGFNTDDCSQIVTGMTNHIPIGEVTT